MSAVEFSFQAPAALLSMNDRHHWRKRAELVKAWRNGAWAAAHDADLGYFGAGRVRDVRCEVAVTLTVRDRRRRDPHNYYPTVKAIIDGLVDAGGWPDDTPEWVTTREPVLRVGSDRLVIVRLTPVAALAETAAPEGEVAS